MKKNIFTFITLCGIAVPAGKLLGLAIAPWFV
jgi:hypothetical protein